MEVNNLYDIIIIGASNAGLKAAEILTKNTSKKIAIISKSFSEKNISGITYIQDEVKLLDFKRGLLIAWLSNNTMVCGLKIIIAIGTAPKHIEELDHVNTHYSLPTSLIKSDSNVVIVGSNKLAINFATTLSNFYKNVYICSTYNELCKNKLDILNEYNNIKYLQNCNITSCTFDTNNKLTAVKLDTYSIIACSDIYISVGVVPAVINHRNMLNIDANGYIKTDATGFTGYIPGLYAIGTCTKQKAIKTTIKIIEEISKIL